MLSSIALMDGVIIVISVDKAPHEKPQLLQHLAAVVLGKFDKIIICLNKIDLVTKDVVLQRKEELDIMLEQYGICPFAVIPTCFNKKIGMNYLTKAIMELFNPSEFENKKSTTPYFHISRSFDINKPGTNWANLKGGVIGGSLSSGKFTKNDIIEIRPGILVGKTPKMSCKPIHTNISTLKTDTTEIDEVQPGGLVGIGTDIDPLYCKDNYLSGNIAGLVGTLPSVFIEITVDINKIELFGFTWDPKVKDQVEIQIGTHMANSVSVEKIKKKTITFLFVSPVCIPDNQHIVICRTISGILRIVAEGYVQYKSNPKPLLV
jgi:translation initiation factor 2 subunit 3